MKKFFCVHKKFLLQKFNYPKISRFTVCALNRAGDAIPQASGAKRKRGRGDADLEDTHSGPGSIHAFQTSAPITYMCMHATYMHENSACLCMIIG